jgi:hypothetical protein
MKCDDGVVSGVRGMGRSLRHPCLPKLLGV